MLLVWGEHDVTAVPDEVAARLTLSCVSGSARKFDLNDGGTDVDRSLPTNC